MHIPKYFLAALLSTAVSASSLHAQQRPDNDAQAKAREALRALEGGPAPAPATNNMTPPVRATAPANPPAAVTPTSSVPPQQMAPPDRLPPAMSLPPARSSVAMPQPSGGLTPDQEEKARAALHSAMASEPEPPKKEVKTEVKKTPKPAAPAVATTPEAKPPKKPATPVTPATPPATVATQPPATPVTITPEPKPVTPTVTPMAPVQPVMSAPAPDTKEGKLQALLQEYKDDKISPSEYQARRAKILAEP